MRRSRVYAAITVNNTAVVNHVYWGAYLDTSVPIHYYGSTDVHGLSWATGPFSATKPGNTWDVMEAHVGGKTMSLILFGWGFRFGGFPTTPLNDSWNRGCIPAMNMFWGDDNTTGGVHSFTNAQIINGDNDTNWNAFFTGAKNLNKPFFLIPCVEMNGSWTYEGGLKSDGTFDPVSGNTPSNFKSAWIHLWNLCQSIGATNVTWAWVPNAINPSYAGIYDDVIDYYPGDQYVDWTGFDTFSFSDPHNGTFTQVATPTYNKIIQTVNASKPMLISQTAAPAADSSSDPTDNVAWANSLFGGLPSLPMVKGVMWFSWHAADGATHNLELEDPCSVSVPISVSDWGSNSGMNAAQIFASGISNPRYKNKMAAPVTGLVKVPLP